MFGKHILHSAKEQISISAPHDYSPTPSWRKAGLILQGHPADSQCGHRPPDTRALRLQPQ